jgi:hypothetical protein
MKELAPREPESKYFARIRENLRGLRKKEGFGFAEPNQFKLFIN